MKSSTAKRALGWAAGALLLGVLYFQVGKAAYKSGLRQGEAQQEAKDKTRRVLEKQSDKKRSVLLQQAYKVVANKLKTGEITQTRAEAELDAIASLAERYPSTVVAAPPVNPAASSPYPHQLGRFLVQGTPEDPKASFIAVFQTLRDREPTMAAWLKPEMMLKLDLEPFERQPKEIRDLPAVYLSDEDPSLPVYWVKSFQHENAELHAAVDPRRSQFFSVILEGVKKSAVDIPSGKDRRPIYYYGGNWAIYAPYAERWLLEPRPASCRLAIQKLHAYTSALGVQLMIVPMPQSASLFPDVALGTFDGEALRTPPINGAMRNLLHVLKRDEGLLTCDLSIPLAGNRFQKVGDLLYPVVIPNDTHLSSAGYMRAAKILAEAIRRTGSLTRAPLPPGAFTLRETVVSHPGDLQNHSLITSLRLKMDPSDLLLNEVVPTTPEAEKALNRSHPDAEIHIIGDSNADALEGTQAGLRSHLVRELGVPVHSESIAAEGHGNSPKTWVENKELHRSAKILVWVVAERFYGYDFWYQAPPPESAAALHPSTVLSPESPGRQ